MTRDVTRLNFYSGDPIDKVVMPPGIISITNDGNTTSSGTGDGDQIARIVTSTIPNLYSKKVFCRFVWSVDGTNFNSGESHLIYGYTITLTDIPFTSPPIAALQAAVSVGISASTITFITGNGYHGNVSRLSSDFSGTTGYTPISQTFVIKYALFEIT